MCRAAPCSPQRCLGTRQDEPERARGPPAGTAALQLDVSESEGKWRQQDVRLGGRSRYLACDFGAQPIGGLEQTGVFLYPFGEGGRTGSSAGGQGHPSRGHPQRHLPGAHEGTPRTCLKGERWGS